MTEEVATLGGGCYWCLEAIYQRLKGVAKVTSGYSGGHVENPSVDEVYADGTGHAEVVQVEFDPSVVSYREILEIFFVMHDPTTLNRQGNDVGEIYRSVIFYHNDEQKRTAEDMIKNFAPTLWKDPIVTQLEPLRAFYPAEEYMQDYYNKNPSQAYCQIIIDPKIQKLRQKYTERLKPATA
jgi:peptide-methionine (S)-S-oxide reductase